MSVRAATFAQFFDAKAQQAEKKRLGTWKKPDASSEPAQKGLGEEIN